MSTPERQQDPGDHGYGGTQQEKNEEDRTSILSKSRTPTRDRTATKKTPTTDVCHVHESAPLSDYAPRGTKCCTHKLRIATGFRGSS